MKAVVIGCGSAGTRHIRNLLDMGVDVAGCDMSEERQDYVNKTFGIPCRSDYAGLLKGSNLAVICTPTRCHVEHAQMALENGCHVLVEKPISHGMYGVDYMLSRAAEKHLVLMVGFNFNFHPAFQKMRELVQDGAIGQLEIIRCHAGSYFLYRAPYHTWKDYREDYAAQSIGGGVILDSATHHIDFILNLMGNVERVFCFTKMAEHLDLKAEATAEILMTGDALANIHVNFIQQPYSVGYELIGRDGTIRWEASGDTVRLLTPKGDFIFSYQGFDHNETYRQEMRYFLRAIENGDEGNGAQGKRVLEIALAALESAKTGKAVNL